MTPFEYLEETKQKRLDELKQFLSFPSVSAKSEHKQDVADCAEWLKNHMSAIGFTAELSATQGNPVVYAEYMADPKAPTVLYYGHYDVQPPEPLSLWTTPPFQAEVRDGYLYARGSADDKGQTFTHIKGMEALIKTSGKLPINVKFLIEGEEEVHSVNLPEFLKDNKNRLRADIVVISDTAQFNKTLPAITYGLRGIASCEVFVYGPNRDVHSGTFGGAIANPITVLCQLVAQFHDKNNKVAIPGFYKDVKPVTKFEKSQYKKLPYKEGAYRKALSISALHGEKGYTTFERTWDRPTCEINGITGGYQGEGAKTIIPAMASCKITMRLVPNQKPLDICNKLERYLKKLAPTSVRIKVNKHGGAPGVVVPTTGPWLDAAARAIKAGFGKAPVFMKEGGSIPVVSDFKKTLGIDTLLIGFAQSDDNIHSPDERFRLVDFERGCRTAAMLPEELAKVKR
ncbi:MAG: dipeptidase [candidate division Zixibacteria bacterium]|nr:dipeptidase [candidate division Zixibacteria bacterium]